MVPGSVTTIARAGARWASSVVTMARQAAARSNPSGRCTGSPVGSTDPHAVDAEGALSGVGPGDQVPDLVLDHQAQRVHDAGGHRAVTAGVAQPDLHGLDHRLLE